MTFNIYVLMFTKIISIVFQFDHNFYFLIAGEIKYLFHVYWPYTYMAFVYFSILFMCFLLNGSF